MALIKKLLFGLFLCSVSILYAQKGISYQGVVLYPSVELPGIDSKVTPYSEKDVCFRFSIYDDANVLEYSETHTTTTDYYGQVNLIIGRGDNPSIAGRLEVLKWDGTAKFLKVELDYAASCSSWKEIAYDELNYVPFAFYALNSQSSVVSAQGTPPINVTGTGTTTDPVVITFDGELNDLNDVNLTSTPVANQALIFDGTRWVAGTANDADFDITNEIQDLSLSGNSINLSGSIPTVDLTPYLDNTDEQDVTVALDNTTNILSIDISGDTDTTNDADVNLTPYLDNTDNQNLNLTGNTLSISNGSTTVDLSPYLDNSDNQDLNLTGNTLSISNGSTTVDLSPYLDDTDKQNLTAGPNSGEVSITGGNSVTLNVNDADSDPANEIQIVDVDKPTKTITYTDASGTPQQAVNDLTEVLDINDAADVTISAPPADNDILSYDISLSRWVNKPVRELKIVEIVNEDPPNPQYNIQKPLLIALTNSNPFDGGSSTTASRYFHPNDSDIFLIGKDNSNVVLGELNAAFNGKIITIVELDNENPLISVENSTSEYFDSSSGENYLFKNTGLFNGSTSDKQIKHESVEFIWYNGNWYAMR